MQLVKQYDNTGNFLRAIVDTAPALAQHGVDEDGAVVVAGEPVVGEDGVGALHAVVHVLEHLHPDPLAAEEGDGRVELTQGGGAVGVQKCSKIGGMSCVSRSGRPPGRVSRNRAHVFSFTYIYILCKVG